MVILNPKKIILISCLLALSSCINIEEEVFLNPDGSGRIQIYYIAKEELFRMIPGGDSNLFPTSKEDVYRKFQGVEGVTVEGVDIQKKEQQVHMKYLLSFEDITAFNNPNNRFALADKGNTQLFHFWIRGGGSNKQFSSENLRRKIFGQALEQSMAGYAFRMIIHFAYPVAASNAQVVEGNTATWEIPIWDLQKEDSFTMEATLKVKESWWEKIRAIF